MAFEFTGYDGPAVGHCCLCKGQRLDDVLWSRCQARLAPMLWATMWDPPVISWFISPSNYSYFRTINHSYWSYLHQLSYLTGASLIVGICVWELWTWICPSLGISWWIQWIHGFRRSGSVRSTHHGHQLPPNSGDHPSKSCFGWRWFFDHGVIYLISNSKNSSAMVPLCLRSVMCFLYFPLVSFSKNMLEKCC